MTEELQTDYLDRYEGVQAWIHQVSQFDDSSVVHTTYLGKSGRTRKGVIRAQEQFSITGQSTTVGTLLDGTDCKILFDSGYTESFMSKQYYLRNKTLHGLQMFILKANVIQANNGESVNSLFYYSYYDNNSRSYV